MRERTRLYRIWSNMKSRCCNPNVPAYERYGARGVVVCPEWMDFDGFEVWALASGYSAGLEIDRVDSTGNYDPSNCRWVNDAEQSRNRGSVIWISAFGETKTPDWSRDERCPVGMHALRFRLQRGWEVERAITDPPYTRRDAA